MRSRDSCAGASGYHQTRPDNHVRRKLVQSLHVMEKGLFNEVALLDSSGANVLFEQRTGRRGDQRRDLALFFHFYIPQYYSTIF
jgi:hypothetical protein